MAHLSPRRKVWPILDGLKLLHRGKVRDTYELDDHRLLIAASNGISIFDFVLNALIPQKGDVLNALSHFWFKKLEAEGIKTHMIAAGSEIDPHLPPDHRGNVELQMRAMVVRKLTMCPVEFIARKNITGSVLAQYKKDGTIYGTRIEQGLEDGDELEKTLFTPTTKADVGHDEEISVDFVRGKYQEETLLFLKGFAIIAGHARRHKIIMADGKGELGRDRLGFVRFGDEFGTPDSSRFWDAIEWETTRSHPNRKAPSPLDKQLVRGWGIGAGINKLDPTSMLDVKTVGDLVVPPSLIAQTTDIYRYIFWRLTGSTLERYARSEMGIDIRPPRRKLAIVLGSESDLATSDAVLASHKQLADGVESIDVHVISCHRNPHELEAFAQSGCGGVDVIIAAGGKALALPGVLDALLQKTDKPIPVIGVALGEESSRSLEAAVLSIEELPGSPVIIDEARNVVYAGVQGFNRALDRVAHGELPPPKPRATKETRLFLQHIEL